jgi:hypothetical protein
MQKQLRKDKSCDSLAKSLLGANRTDLTRDFCKILFCFARKRASFKSTTFSAGKGSDDNKVSVPLSAVPTVRAAETAVVVDLQYMLSGVNVLMNGNSARTLLLRCWGGGAAVSNTSAFPRFSPTFDSSAISMRCTLRGLES